MSPGIITAVAVGALSITCHRAWKLVLAPANLTRAPSTRRRSRWHDQVVRFEQWVERRRVEDEGQQWEHLLSSVSRDVRSGASLSMAIETACSDSAAPDALTAWWSNRTVGALPSAPNAPDHAGIAAAGGGTGAAGHAGASPRRTLPGRTLPAPPLPEPGREPSPASRHRERPDRFALLTLDVLIELGGRPGAALDRAVSTLAQRRSLAAERRAHAAQAKISARVLGWVAPGFAGWSITTDAAVRSFLIGSPAGWICLTIGGSLSFAGARWMHRLVRQ